MRHWRNLMVWIGTLSLVSTLAAQPPESPRQDDRIGSGNALPLDSGDAALPDDRARAGRGLLEAGIDYGRSWRSGDFLAELREGVDTIGLGDGRMNLDGILVERHELHRVSFDLIGRRFRVLSLASAEAMDLARQRDGLPPHAHSTSLFGAVLDAEGTSFLREFPKSTVRRPLRFWYRGPGPLDEKACFDRVRFPDPRGAAYCGGLYPNGFECAKDIVDSRPGRFWQFVDVQAAGNGRVAVRYLDQGPASKNDPGPAMVETWEIESARVVPVKRTMGVPGAPRILLDCRMNWIELAGVQVISTLQVFQPNGSEVIHLQQHVGEKITELRIHWFRFNEELPEEMFDGRILDDEEAVRALLDPVRSGADTLLSPHPPRDSNNADNGQRP